MSTHETEDNFVEDAESSLVPSPVDVDRLSDDLQDDLLKLANPYLKDPKFKPLRKEIAQHREAFLYWSMLLEKERTDRAVANKFNTSAAAVGRWRKSFNWEARLEYMRREDLEAKTEAIKSSTTDVIFSMLAVSNLVVESFRRKIALNEVKISIKDFVDIGRFAVELRKELKGAGKENGDLLNRLDTLVANTEGGAKQLIINNLVTYISGEQKLPHDAIIESNKAIEIQGQIENEEIGESESEEFWEDELDSILEEPIEEDFVNESANDNGHV